MQPQYIRNRHQSASEAASFLFKEFGSVGLFLKKETYELNCQEEERRGPKYPAPARVSGDECTGNWAYGGPKEKSERVYSNGSTTLLCMPAPMLKGAELPRPAKKRQTITCGPVRANPHPRLNTRKNGFESCKTGTRPYNSDSGPTMTRLRA